MSYWRWNITMNKKFPKKKFILILSSMPRWWANKRWRENSILSISTACSIITTVFAKRSCCRTSRKWWRLAPRMLFGMLTLIHLCILPNTPSIGWVCRGWWRPTSNMWLFRAKRCKRLRFWRSYSCDIATSSQIFIQSVVPTWLLQFPWCKKQIVSSKNSSTPISVQFLKVTTLWPSLRIYPFMFWKICSLISKWRSRP